MCFVSRKKYNDLKNQAIILDVKVMHYKEDLESAMLKLSESEATIKNLIEENDRLTLLMSKDNKSKSTSTATTKEPSSDKKPKKTYYIKKADRVAKESQDPTSSK